jgi:pyruvate dehydrogenase E2 component (dihydrolipoamide acetyltransferase)
VAQSIDVRVPDIGDFKDVPVIEILVKPGDAVRKNDSLITLESDKASMEVPSPADGTIGEIKVKIGDKVAEGTPILTLSAGSAEDHGEDMPRQGQHDMGTSSIVELKVPDIGDFKDVPVIEVSVKPGDEIAKDATLITLESDKATMEVPATAAGTVQDVRVKAGDKVSQGTVIATVVAAGTVAESAAAVAPPKTPPLRQAQDDEKKAAPAAVAPAIAAPSGNGMVHASPSIRKLARELGVDLHRVNASGPNGRVTREDVQNFVKRALQNGVAAPGAGSVGGLNVLPWPKVDFSQYGEVERKPLSRIKKISGANLHRNWVMIPHVTQNDDADVTELEAFRKELNASQGSKVTMLAFLIKASIAALKKFPEFNSSLDGEELVYKRYYNIGFAADTPNGLVVPVIKDADRKGIAELAKESADLAAKARDGKVGPGDMQGGTFTISSLGSIGGTYFTPIINAPEVAILGACRAAIRPVWNGNAFEPRLIQPLSLSYDHRIIDGAAAARFTAYLASVLSDLRRALL